MYKELLKKLSAFGQEHLLEFWAQLSSEEQKEFACQLNAVDFAELSRLIDQYVLKKPEITIPQDLTPAPYFPLKAQDEAQSTFYDQAAVKGKELLRQGKVACLTVAGGQGTRLGFDAPKGTYPIAPVSGKSLFCYFAESIKRASEKYGAAIHWYIMTSQLNCESTKKFFTDHHFFGLDEKQLHFFVQGTMPAIGYDGKLLLADKGSLALSPDGHGGTLLALRKSGSLDHMLKTGIEYISYFQVDNPLVPVVDPFFIGLHAMEKSQMSAIMLAKTGPYEKLGNFCMSNGRLHIIEYSDLPKELAESTLPDGSLRFLAGSPAIHVISVDFVDKMTASGTLSLPWHRADKKVAYISANGDKVEPQDNNAVKLESFIFDALPLAVKTAVVEADRADVFAPTKNRTGVDSVESCRQMMVARDVRRLEKAGVSVPKNSAGTSAFSIEISPLVAIDEEDVAHYVAHNNLEELSDQAASIYLY